MIIKNMYAFALGENKYLMKKRGVLFAMFVLLTLIFTGCEGKASDNLYADSENWAYAEVDETNSLADVFFICPTVYDGNENSFNMDLEDEKTKSSFLGAINMEKGIYDYQFFYRNLQENVETRISEYFK